MSYDLKSILDQLNVNTKDVAEFLGEIKSNFCRMLENKRPIPYDSFITLFSLDNILHNASANNILMPEGEKPSNNAVGNMRKSDREMI